METPLELFLEKKNFEKLFTNNSPNYLIILSQKLISKYLFQSDEYNVSSLCIFVSICGIGVAYEAYISGLRVLDGPMTDVMEAAAFTQAMDINDIYSCR